jgi:arylsulfatase A-like enzyme
VNNKLSRREFVKSVGLGTAGFFVHGIASGKNVFAGETAKKRPNILWLVVEDMSPHWSCYGETVIRTPNIDRLAEEGALFKRAFVTCPVCSPSRSAMVTGMFQNTIGSHNHRSSYPGARVKLPAYMKLIPEYLKEQGYFTVNGGPKKTVYANDPSKKKKKLGKTDYNFVWDSAAYDSDDWQGRAAGQPFFAQIQLRGGKYRGAKVSNPVDPAKVKLPPYYPDDPVIREDWANYLNSVIYLDIEVSEILQRLEDEGVADNTVVFLWTDHGISHARGKQFLYDEGLHVPFVMRWPGVIKAGTVRQEMVSHIDISATSLYAAGIDVPAYMEGQVLVGPDYKARDLIIGCRDRCDETLDCIRCVRTKQFKYIRNFHWDRAHLQPNRYKNGKKIIKRMRELHAKGKLDALQAGLLGSTRPIEELYDLDADPYEINNLAGKAEYQGTLVRMRKTLFKWMQKSGDLGIIPEPELEKLAKKSDSRYAILRQKENKYLVRDILKVVEAGDKGKTSVDTLVGKMSDSRGSIRWWAARKLGSIGSDAGSAEKVLKKGLRDRSASVRVECALALSRIGMEDGVIDVLLSELKNPNPVVRHYAALAIEDIGEKARPALDIFKAMKKSEYEYVKRLGVRFVSEHDK